MTERVVGSEVRSRMWTDLKKNQVKALDKLVSGRATGSSNIDDEGSDKEFAKSSLAAVLIQ